MTKRYLLLGAGFSRNWGGWLANEAFEYLIGHPDIRARGHILKVLWDHAQEDKGGYEGALEELQGQVGRSVADSKQALDILEYAIGEMFKDMNAGFMDLKGAFSHEMRNFLARFDAIYTLNQDLLLERNYMFMVFPLRPPPKLWDGCVLPGINPPPVQNFIGDTQWLTEHWRMLPQTPTVLPPRNQPVIKLHGSSLWRRDDSRSGVLVMGGNKAGAINRDPLLKWYAELFANALKERGARLMAIGYGYRDGHVNQTIADGISSGGLTLYNISPDGLKNWLSRADADATNAPGKNDAERTLIGASRRSIRDIVMPNDVEHRKVMRFFS